MQTFLFILIGALLTRLDGWGPTTSDRTLTRISKLFNVWTCSILFGLAAFVITTPLPAIVSGFAFLVFRAPGFNQWEDWMNMFWRGAWTSFIGFTALSFVVRSEPVYGFLFIPMGLAEMLAYSGSYNWLSKYVSNKYIHPIAEFSSGVAFSIFIAIILGSV